MSDRDKTKQQLSSELEELRRRVAALEVSETAWRQAEEARWESEQRLSLHFRQTPLAAIEWDLEWRVAKWNPAAERIFGYSQDEAVGRHVTFILPAHVREHVDQLMGALRAREGGERSTNENVTKDGRTILCEWYNTPLIDADGRVIGAASLAQDITDSKRAEAALRSSEAKYRRLHQSMTDAFVSVDVEGHIRECNEAYRAMLGYESEELLALRYQDLTPEKWHSYEAEIVEKQILGRGYSEIYEKEYRRKDGTIFPVELRAFLIRDERGEPSIIWGIARDISERKRAQAALQKAHDELERRVEERTAELAKADKELRASEELFRVAFDAAPVGIVIGVADGVISRANRALSQMSGFAPEELVGLHSLELTHPEDREKTKTLLRALFSGETGAYTVEKRYLKKEGGFFWARTTTAAVRDATGKVAFALAILQDITEEKAAQETLQQSHDELRAIYDGMADGIAVIDLAKASPVRVNAAICQMLGYSEDELKTLAPSVIHPPEVMPTVYEHVQAVCQGKVARLENLPFLRKDGSAFYADAVSSRILFNGRPCRISFIHDVTAHKLAEEALQREHRTLKHMLQAGDHERQMIAYDIHDGLAQQLAGAIMQFQTFDHMKDKQPAMAAKAYEAGLTMLRQGHFETRRLIANVRHPILDEQGVVEAIGLLVHEQRRSTRATITFNNTVGFDRLLPILENAIYRIAQEALANACQHSKSKRIRVSLSQRGDRVHIEVRDWGMGFDATTVKGKRFGLEGIRQRARLLRGKCSIRSKEGEGTCVTVELPVLELRREGPSNIAP